MADPLALFPFALAAGGGRIDEHDASQLVAAGTTLLQRSVPLVRALAGKRSAILLPTGTAYFTALAASDGRGAVLVNPLASAREIAAQLHESDVGAVFTNSALASRLPAGVPIVLLDNAPGTARTLIDGRTADVDLGDHFGLSLEGSAEAEGRDEEAIVVYSSGMNGYMRGARLTHRNLLSSARSTIVAADIDSDSHSLALLPMAHLFGLVVSTGAPLIAGARVTTMDRYNPMRALDIIASDGITHLSAVPSVYAGLLQAMERRGASFVDHALRVCIVGGAPLDVSLQDKWAEMTRVELRQGYGLTEAGPVCSFNLANAPNRRGTIGVPFPGVEMSIRSVIGDDVALPAEDVGEICVRGVNVFAGYVGNATDALEIRDGWLRTGDLGIRDEGGTYEFRGLKKAMFTRNGFNIYPHEIERVVCELAGVEHAVVSSSPDPVKENEIVLDIQGEVAEDAVREWCARNLSVYKQPNIVRVTAR